MIKSILVINNYGKARLLKFYGGDRVRCARVTTLLRRAVAAAPPLTRCSRARAYLPPSPPPPLPSRCSFPSPHQPNGNEQQSIVRDVFNVVSKRPSNVCNFVEGETCVLVQPTAAPANVAALQVGAMRDPSHAHPFPLSPLSLPLPIYLSPASSSGARIRS